MSLDHLFEKSDYISVHLPLTKSTRGFIDYNSFAKMKKTPTFINMSRGEIVITDDLIKALINGNIRFAGLDVTDPEPIPMKHELNKMENCIILPHIGTATFDCREKMASLAANNIINHYK